MTHTSIYEDIAKRTGGDIYLGVMGPVRSGKSTFIKRFMDLMVLPRIGDEAVKRRTVDEMPQSAQGKTIMTTEPKFVPKDAVEVYLEKDVPVRIKLIDCVGFLIDGVNGHMEDGSERMVKTPWYDYEIPFAKAAEVGTEKVLRDHATIGIVVTTDGSFTDLARENYIPAEEKTIHELQQIHKPFVVLYNTPKPYSAESEAAVRSMEEKYGVSVLSVNCEQLKVEDIRKILQKVLYEFPVSRLDVFLPKWVEMLPETHKVKQAVIAEAKRLLQKFEQMKDVMEVDWTPEREEIQALDLEQTNLSDGSVRIGIKVGDELYFQNISELTGTEIHSEYDLISMIRELSEKKEQYQTVADAVERVHQQGYGVVSPSMGEINIEEPVLMKHGNRYGVKIRASSPSIHMIRANIETEIAPIIGTEEQANDLITYMKQNQDSADGLWKINIFGKSIGELVEAEIQRKIMMMDEASQQKLQNTMQKIVNESSGGLVCIII